MRRVRTFLGVAGLLSAISPPGIAAKDNAKRRVTVADTIRMTTLPENAHAAGDTTTGRFARFSPDGNYFVVVTDTGNPETNENVFSLFLFSTTEVFQHPRPRVLATMRSRSNRDAIKNVRWVDNEILCFIGETEDLGQVYSVNIATGVLAKLTSSPTSVIDFDVNLNSGVIVYSAEPGRPEEAAALYKFHHGYAITIESPDNLPRTKRDFLEPDETLGEEVFVKRFGATQEQVALGDRFMPFKPILVSPDGKHTMVAVLMRDVPPSWIAYEDELIRAEVKSYRRKGSTSWLMRYMLIDLKTKSTKPLLPGPVAWSNGGAVWSKDGKRVVVSGAFLPLDVDQPAERAARAKHPFAVDVDVATGKFEKITDKDVVVTGRSADSGAIYFLPASRAAAPTQTVFMKTLTGWREEPDAQPDKKSVLPAITLEQDLNTPPKLYASDAAHPEKTLLLDLNPQFAELVFAKVEAVRWKATDGHEVEGGLYLPPGYKPGTRYPLVIQTHGFSDKQFWINGPWNSAFAAQPLAANGIVVLQVGHGTESGAYMKHHRSLEEAPREMSAYEGAIDYLDSRGIVDRERVGIIGFSRTQYHVEYTLTHSSYHFAAATLADGFDGGYLQYLNDPYTEKDSVFVNGGPPFGANFSNWLEHSPSFRLDRIHLPVRIECYGPGVISCWEPYSVLTHLGRPVELIYLPDAVHILVKPWERMTSQQGNVDWYRFWLKGEEDSDPAKAEQYERWREMRRVKNESKNNLGNK